MSEIQLLKEWGDYEVGTILTLKDAADQQKLVDSGTAEFYEEPRPVHKELSKEAQMISKVRVEPRSTKDIEFSGYGEKGFGDFIADVKAFGSPGGQPSDKIRALADSQQKTWSGLNPEDGGVLLPQGFSGMLMNTMSTKSEIYNQCKKVPMQQRTVDLPRFADYDHTDAGTGLYGGLKTYWRGETDRKTEVTGEVEAVSLSAKSLACLTYLSNEMIADSPIATGDLVMNAMASAISFEVTNCIVAGSGAGQPLGFLNGAGTTTITRQGCYVSFYDLVRLYARMINPQNAVFVANQGMLEYILTACSSCRDSDCSDLTAYPVPAFVGHSQDEATGGIIGTILGRPLIISEHAIAAGTEGDLNFCNFKDGYILGERSGITGSTNPYIKWDYNLHGLLCEWRGDGQPVMVDTLTPKNGTDELGHFVNLSTQ